jgi:diketogulonate reductase-like aldo/keto reductase
LRVPVGLPFIVPIPGTGKVKHLQENIESNKLLLTAEDMREIANALAEFKVHGGRMNEEQMKVVEQWGRSARSASDKRASLQCLIS